MHQTIIKIKKSTPPAKLKMITAIIEGLFNNRAGKVPNTGTEPYTLVFAGDDRDWGCIDLGALTIKDVPGLRGYISSYWSIDEENQKKAAMYLALCKSIVIPPKFVISLP